MDINKIMTNLEKKHSTEVEYLQAVKEVLKSIVDVYNENPQFESAKIIERIVEPDRVIIFKVPWIDDKGEIQINLGYRVQFNNALGPYKGGLRFHPSVNLSIMKFLGFEQIFKNSLTTLALGGAKGGSDFDPKGKSNAEVMRFCQSFMLELWRYIDPEIDVPAGDIGVGTREIGFLYGMYKRIKREHSGVLTGKDINWGGSHIRPEATGFGLIYFIEEMFATRNYKIKGKTVCISGSGNVAQFAAEKIMQMGAKVVTLSDSNGFIYDPDGIDESKLEYVKELKNIEIGRIIKYTEKYGVDYFENKRPWRIKCDIALPCATQNEITEEDAKTLVENGCICVAEGANMPSTPEAIEVFHKNGLLFAPGKAANAGGVAISGLEMSQNAMKLSWSRNEVDNRLHEIMRNIHSQCVKYGKRPDGYVDYVKGANVAGFLRVANAMLDMGII